MISVREQLEIVKGLMGYRYGDAEIDSRATDAIVAQMAIWGITDIRDFARVDDTKYVDCTAGGGASGTLTGYHYVNLRTGARLNTDMYPDGVFWTGFASEDGRNFGGSGDFWCPVYDTGGDILRIISEGGYSWDSRFDGYVGDAGMRGDDRIQIFVQFTSNGIPYFQVRLFNTRGMSFWTAVKELATIALAALTFAVPGVNAAIAGSIFGPLAVSYPALTAAASQVMLNTALSGGDVEAAVKSVAYSYLGNAAGGVVQGVSDSDALGRLAAAATTAAAQGGDVERAVAAAALRLVPSVASDAIDYFQSDERAPIDADVATAFTTEVIAPSVPVDTPIDSNTGESAVSIFDVPTSAPTQDWDALYAANYDAPSVDEIASWAPANADLSTAFADAGSVPESAPVFEPVGYSLDDLFEYSTGSVPVAAPAAATGETPLQTAIAETPANQSVEVPASSFFEDVTWDDTVENLTDLAIAAIRVHQAYQAANRPPTQPAVQTTRTGSTQTVRADGTLATTDPTTGRVVTTRPPAGVPYELPNGAGAVINNGNGTYSVISPTGQTTTRSYASDTPAAGVAQVQAETWVPGVPNWAILAVGVGALAVITRR